MNPLQTRLVSLRRRLRSVTLVRGLSLVVLALLGAGLLAGGLDWLVHLPGAIRALLLVGALAGVLAVAQVFLLAPLKAKTDDLALALRVEREYPVLNDALASTVQFLQQPEDSTEAGSPALRKEAVQRALRLAQGCDFNRVVNTKGLRLSGLTAAAVAVVVALLFLWYPTLALSATLRLVHPFGEHDWPTQTRLHLDFPPRVAAGKTVQIRGTVSGVIPKNAVVRLKGYVLGDGSPRDYPITLSQDGKAGTFEVKLHLKDQRDNIQFAVEVNDIRAPKKPGSWHTIEVAQPPRLIAVDGKPAPQKIELIYPAYTDLPSPKALAAGTKEIHAIEGTWVTMEAKADRPLQSAWIQFQPSNEDESKVTVLDGAKLALLGISNPFGIAATQVLAEQAWDKVPVQLDETRTKVLIHFRPWLSGPHILTIVDDTGLASDEKFDIQLLADPPPLVTLEQPATNRTLMPKAEVHLEITAHDEKFGLRSVFLEYWRKDKNGHLLDHKIQRVLLYNEDLVRKDLDEGVTDAEGNSLTLPAAAGKLKPLFIRVKKSWSLEGLVKEGDILVIRAGADDFNDVTAHSTPGYSHEVEITIVGKTEMNISLDKAQAKLQEKLAHLKELQKGALDNVQEIEKKWAEGKPVKPDDLKKLLDKVQDAAQWQKEMQDLIGKEKKDGLLPELEQLEQIIQDNKIDSSDAKDRVKLLKSELNKIDKKLQLINPPLAKIKQQLDIMDPAKAPDQKDGTKEFADAKGTQKQVLQALDDLLKHLDRWAQLHQIREEAQKLLEEQQKVQAATEKLDTAFAPKDKNWKDKSVQLANQQFQLAIDAQRLLDKLAKAREDEAEKHPDIAKLLEEAFGIAEENKLTGQMKSADEALRKQQLKNALKIQDESIDTLKRIVEALTEKRENQLEKLLKQQEQAKSELKDFTDKLEKLQKQVEEAKKIADPEQQKQALQKLAQEQQNLLEEAQKKAMELARLRADEAAQEINKAAKQMEQALQKLQGGNDPFEEQQQALEQMKKAQKKLQQAQKEAEDELAREKLVKIADQILALKERQDAANLETERLHKLVLQGGWKAEVGGGYINLKESQKLVAQESANLSQKLKGAKVFEMILSKAGANMELASKQMEERLTQIPRGFGDFPFPPDILKKEVQSHDSIVKLQMQASQRLQTLLDAIKEAQKQMAKADEPEKGGPDQPSDGPKQKGGLQAQDGIPGIAQLLALKDEQMRVNQRTKALAKEFPNLNDLPPPAQIELKSIHADQAALFELFQEISAAAKQGEKK